MNTAVVIVETNPKSHDGGTTHTIPIVSMLPTFPKSRLSVLRVDAPAINIVPVMQCCTQHMLEIVEPSCWDRHRQEPSMFEVLHPSRVQELAKEVQFQPVGLQETKLTTNRVIIVRMRYVTLHFIVRILLVAIRQERLLGLAHRGTNRAKHFFVLLVIPILYSTLQQTECLSSSDHDADSSDDEDIMELEDRRQRRQNNPHLDGASAVTKSTVTTTSNGSASAPYMTLMRGRQPALPRRSRRRRYDDLGMAAPYIALPPLESFRSIEIEIDPDYNRSRRRRHRHRNHNSTKSNNSSDNNNNNGNVNMDQSEASSSSSSSPSSQDSREFPPAIILPPNVRPIDLTTDHSAYNP